MDIEKEKKDFLYTEIAKAAIEAATQHNTFYKPDKKTSKKKKEEIIRYWTDNLLHPKKSKYKDEQKLDEFVNDVLEIRDELNNKFSEYIDCLVSHAQKSLALYLKYLWCLDVIPEPPTCPIDRLVIWKAKIIKDNDKNKLANWTELNNKTKYRKWLDEKIKVKAQEKNFTMAQWELDLWNREMERRSHRNQQKASSKPSM